MAAPPKSRENGSKILPRAGASYKWRAGKDESALHAEHSVYPHQHPVMENGQPKACSGGFWCISCQEWFSAAGCHASA